MHNSRDFNHDVEFNLWPNEKPNSCFNFSIAHWNLNSLTSHNIVKVNLLEVYDTVKNVDIFSVRTLIQPSILTENNNLKVNGYKMARAYHPNNVKRGCVCAYIREYLPVRNFSNSYLSECLTLEVTISNKKGYVITFYKFLSQTLDVFLKINETYLKLKFIFDFMIN